MSVVSVSLSVNNRKARKAVFFAALCLLIIAASYPVWRAAQPSAPRLIDHCGDEFSRDAAPIVVAAVVAADTLVRSPLPMHSDPTNPLQFRRLTLRVENVLKGAPIPDKVTVYYFTWAGGFDGPRPLGFWNVGARRIWWLQRESGVLRTACDGWDGCTIGVQSGAHPNYTSDSKRPINYALADLLLTRGEGPVDDNGFAGEIEWGVPDEGLQGYVVEKLRHLATTEHGAVKSSSCKLLWIYSVDRIAPTIRQDANNALHAASCLCNTRSDGNVECM